MQWRLCMRTTQRVLDFFASLPLAIFERPADFESFDSQPGAVGVPESIRRHAGHASGHSRDCRRCTCEARFPAETGFLRTGGVLWATKIMSKFMRTAMHYDRGTGGAIFGQGRIAWRIF